MNSLPDSLLIPSASGSAAAGILPVDAPPKGDDAASAGVVGRGGVSFAAVLGQMQEGREGSETPGEVIGLKSGAAPAAPVAPVAPGDVAPQRQEIAAALAMQWAALVSQAPQSSGVEHGVQVGRAGQVDPTGQLVQTVQPGPPQHLDQPAQLGQVAEIAPPDIGVDGVEASLLIAGSPVGSTSPGGRTSLADPAIAGSPVGSTPPGGRTSLADPAIAGSPFGSTPPGGRTSLADPASRPDQPTHRSLAVQAMFQGQALVETVSPDTDAHVKRDPALESGAISGMDSPTAMVDGSGAGVAARLASVQAMNQASQVSDGLETGEPLEVGQHRAGEDPLVGAWNGASAAGPLWMPDAGQATTASAHLLPPGARAWPAETGLPPLMALQISPQLAVITPASSPAASDRSLLAFAAGQGFDAQALQRIFGAQATQAMPEGVTPAWSAALPAAAATGAPGRRSDAVSVSGLNGGTGVQAAFLTQALGAFQADGGQVQVRAGLSGAVGALQDAAAPNGGVGSSVTAWAALQVRGGGVDGGWAATGLSTPATSVAPLATAMPFVAGGLHPTDLAAAAGGLASVAGTAEMPAATITPAGATAVEATSGLVGSGEPAAPVQAPRTDTPTRPMDTQPIDLRQHLEQGQEALSRRLGEALAARLISQIERGDWQIRLSVAPQHLGPIDIDLQMRGSRIDAQFQVAHGQTQALIQDSLPRLREAVGASGMDLASVWVSGGWSERNRGNPTPRQPDDPAPGALNEGGGDEQSVAAVASVEPNGPGRTPRPGAVDILI